MKFHNKRGSNEIDTKKIAYAAIAAVFVTVGLLSAPVFSATAEARMAADGGGSADGGSPPPKWCVRKNADGTYTWYPC